MDCAKRLEAAAGQPSVFLIQVRVILSGGMKPVSPSVRSATLPFGRITKWVILPLLRDMRNQPSGGNCNALVKKKKKKKSIIHS